ncbi:MULTISPECIES: pyruvate kinase [Priestia]|jgi:pyruvate kinase|uniref:Pyruvate kinase n=4 Tax=Priestia TaxID=2800373 RepID=D5DTV0_PRIM1|nr:MULTISPECIES: pyruvate kinase [Priestia]AVX10646.1 pyruvate kinase [Bacillus sp. Y-01]KOP76717.1 pyruvate kinase [Bacillus sp. FJAT-21351]KQU14341.1 pyruvate kinase [Bacillus sp. Leaf75]KRF58020.1 pyruvate kinase [Bacillus sp. Soil531]MBZ5477729.1 pyruvate kinase [Bacillus sp. T_4]MCF6798645.1 pyruvate kinase [Bacillus sp. ET1]MCJ7984389.1 pyruvate kinase [Priestia sp. OVL9]MDH6652214.1 pyruvate kinase [Bacillus sp. PvP124]MDP9577697.1 pyruvate kinase [Bacillus sp. 1751]RFB25134.1 pyru
MRKTKIVCTIGPASESVEKLVELINSGLNVCRLNFSHGDFEEHGARIVNIREAAKQTGKTVGILLDTKGPEIRTNTMENGAIELEEGSEIIVSMTEVVGTTEKFSITYPGLIDDVHVGSKILLDDGLIGLEVLDINKTDGEIKTKVLNPGTLKNKKGVNVPNVSVNLPGITEKDASDIVFGIEQGIDFIAASFVRRASDVLEIRELLEKHNAAHIQIISKIENQEGVDNIKEILEVSDGLMVARGDLGVEIPAEEVPLVQKDLIKQCNALGKPVITATQMLDSMQRNPRPTRAEASDVANAIFDGTDAIMLSGETAAGSYPVEAVQTMHSIASRAEQALNYSEILQQRSKQVGPSITDAIGQSVVHTALNLNASAIVAPTESGYTAKIVSKYRPQSPIVAVAANDSVARRLSLVWGVTPVVGERVNTIDDMLDHAVNDAVKTGVVAHGDLVVITAGVPVGESGATNLMKVQVVGDVLAKGQGIGRKAAVGKVVIAKTAEEANAKMTEGAILVTNSTDRDMISAIEKAGALITEEGGLTSHAAVVGLNLSIPVIVGVENATSVFSEDQDITVDASRGVVYNGHASVL